MLGPFDRREAAEAALERVARHDATVHARLLREDRSDDGETVYNVLRVVERTRSGLESARTVTPPTAAEPDRDLPSARERRERVDTTVVIVAHGIVNYAPGMFSAWPANSGGQAWHWGNEILIGFFEAVYEEKEGHNWTEPSRFLLSRSLDGGITWLSYEPWFGGAGPAPGAIDFAHPDFTLRVFDESESFYISYDRGRTWPGPYGFGDLFRDSPVAGDELTARTDYIVNSADSAYFLMSSRRQLIFTEDYAYMVSTADAGASFEFESFIDPFDLDPNVMPSTVRISDTGLVTCLRRKDKRDDSHWIECYRSNDNGRSWRSLAQVDSTGSRNGNPPALVRLANGYLVCVYGVRRLQGQPSISAKVSTDNGRTWSTEHRLREDFIGPDAFGDVDLVYPRAFVRPDGKVLAVYYWATASRPEQHIASTIFDVVPSPPAVGIGDWVRGLTQAKAAGDNRLLLLTLHYVEREPRFKQPQSVRYGGQPMTQLLERSQREGYKQTYVAVFYLNEDDIEKATHGDFDIDWYPNPPDNWEAASVFLTHVDQTDPFGDKDTGAATSGHRVACHPFRSVAVGDAVILAGTARKRGRFTLPGGFARGDEFNLTRGGGIRTDGDGIVGHRSVVETADQLGVLEHSDPGTMVIACVQVRQHCGRSS